MNQQIIYITLLCMYFFNPFFLGAKERSTCEERLQFTFDDRQWEKGFEKQTSEASIIEFTLKGEDVNHWTELVTVQQFPKIAFTVEEYYKTFMQDLKASVQPAQVQSKIISQTPDSIFFEWWISGQTPHAQHEWFRLFKTPQSTLVLRYTTKKLNDVEKVRGTWEKILQDAKYSQKNCSILFKPNATP